MCLAPSSFSAPRCVSTMQAAIYRQFVMVGSYGKVRFFLIEGNPLLLKLQLSLKNLVDSNS